MQNIGYFPPLFLFCHHISNGSWQPNISCLTNIISAHRKCVFPFWLYHQMFWSFAFSQFLIKIIRHQFLAIPGANRAQPVYPGCTSHLPQVHLLLLPSLSSSPPHVFIHKIANCAAAAAAGFCNDGAAAARWLFPRRGRTNERKLWREGNRRSRKVSGLHGRVWPYPERVRRPVTWQPFFSSTQFHVVDMGQTVIHDSKSSFAPKKQFYPSFCINPGLRVIHTSDFLRFCGYSARKYKKHTKTISIKQTYR